MVVSAPPLGPGVTTVVQAVLAAGLPAGTHTLFVLVNSSGSVPETDTSNDLAYLSNVDAVIGAVATSTPTPIPTATPTSAPSGSGGGHPPTATPTPPSGAAPVVSSVTTAGGGGAAPAVQVAGVTAPQAPAPAVPAVPAAPALATAPAEVIDALRYVCDGSWFPIVNDTIWNFFTHRGGLPMFGCPISLTFLFQGFTVQFFQRRLVQLDEHGQARLLNVLDPEFLPYTRINGSTFPDVDSQFKARTPAVGSPEYGWRPQPYRPDRAG